MTLKNLSLDIREVASELTRLEKRLRLEPNPDAAALDELRHAVDTTRLTA
jgi:signal transduction protein with GAF and PtsI domain